MFDFNNNTKGYLHKTMKKHILLFTVFAAFIPFAAPFSIPAAEDAAGGYHLKYSVSGRDLTIVSSVTPYDSDRKTKDAYLYWFKRGFEAVIAGKPPLMVEWGNTPAAAAGRKGYDYGIEEADRYLKKDKGERESLQTFPIPPI